MSGLKIFSLWVRSWQAVSRFPVLFFVFVLYRAMWGWLLYQTAAAVMEPLLPRIPHLEEHPDVFRLLVIEGQFLVMKTDLLQPLLLFLAVLVGTRMILTPFFQAGLYYTLSDQNMERSDTLQQRKFELSRFFTGLKRHWKSFWLIAACRWLVLLLACVFWFPYLLTTDLFIAVTASNDLKTLFLTGWKPFAIIVGFLLLIGSFTRVARFSVIEGAMEWSQMFSRFTRSAFHWFCLLILCWIAFILYLILTGISAFASSLLLFLVLRQFGYIVQAALKWVEIRSQYVVWKRTGKTN